MAGDAARAPESRRAAQYAYEWLREAILSGELEAGAPFSQVRVSRELGVSRTPLREAIRRLEQEGLLVASANQRVRVAALELSEFDTLCAVRIINEALAIRLTVPGLAEAEIDAIEALHLRMADGREQAAERWWEDTHRQFHRALIAGATGRIRATMDNAYDHAARFVAAFAWLREPIPAAIPPEVREHGELVEAVRRREPQEAAELLARHHARGALHLITANEPLYDARAVRNALAIVLRDPRS